MRNFILLAIFLGAIANGCRSTADLAEEEHNRPIEAESVYMVGEDLEKDPEIEDWLVPHRETLEEEMGERLATLQAPFRIGKPESPLGNLAADMIRFRAAHIIRKFVHLGLINEDSIRIEFTEDEITLGDIYRFMPYDNTLVILEMTGEQVLKLADEIAKKGGAPISGMRMNINGNSAAGVLVNSEVVQKDKTYYLATTSYVARGGGGFESVTEIETRYDYPVLIRDMYIEYLRFRRNLEPGTDQRIRTL